MRVCSGWRPLARVHLQSQLLVFWSFVPPRLQEILTVNLIAIMSSGNAETRRELYATCKEGSELGAVRDFVSAIRLSKWKDILEGVSKQKLGQLFGILHGHVSAVAEQDEFEDANANYTESGETDSEDLVKNLMLFRSTAEFALAHLMSCSSPR